MTGLGQEVLLRLATFAAAVLGGALAANLRGLGFGISLLLVGGAAVIGAVVATLLAPGERHSLVTVPPGPATDPAEPWWNNLDASPSTGSASVDSGVQPTRRTEPLALPSRQPDLPTGPLPRRTEPHLPPHAEAVVVAQCPQCGSFRLDVQGDIAIELRCRDCTYSWPWAPERPWPPVVVRRDLSERPHHTGATQPPSTDRGASR